MKKFFKSIKNKYYKIYFKIWNWFNYKSPIYISFNPFKFYNDWLKVCRVFRRPVLCKYKMGVDENKLGSDYWYLETKCYNKWLYICSHRCDYKLKYGEIRFESVPHLCIIWRNKTKWIFGLEAPLYEESHNIGNCKTRFSRNNLLYWEAVLTYLYEYNKDIVKTYENNIWTQSWVLKDTDKDTGVHKKVINHFTILPALKNKYAEIIYRYVNSKNNNEEE